MLSALMPNDDSERVNIEVGSGISRRSVMRQVGAAAGAGALLSSPGYLTSLTQDDENGPATDEAPDYTIVEFIPPPDDLDYESRWEERDITMVTHDASTAYFNPTIAGLHDACEQLGWNGNFTGPTGGHSVEEQLTILESTVDARPDVIATTITDPQAYDFVVEEALANDIFVITYDTNALTRDEMREKYGQAFGYAGDDAFAGGYVCGLAGAERLPDDADRVTIGTCCPGHSALEARADGIALALQHEIEGIEVDVLEYTGDAGEGVSRLESHIAATDGLDGLIGTDAFSWFIAEAIRNQGVEDEVLGGGFDLEIPTLEAIQDGVMNYTIGADPYSQGYMPTVLSWVYLDRGMPAKDYPTGSEVIDADNVDAAMQRSEYETLLEWQRDEY